jgi:hypothetical protein
MEGVKTFTGQLEEDEGVSGADTSGQEDIGMMGGFLIYVINHW